MKNKVIVRNLGVKNWYNVFFNMNIFTSFRDQHTLDEIWLVEHEPVYTIGQIEKNSFFSHIYNIPVISSNRGGKITYHAPGQQVVYLLLNLKRLKINIRKLLFLIDTIVLNTLYYFSIIGKNNIYRPGIYLGKKKICSIGLRIQKDCCLHGFALNVKMDLKPFTYIHPCGDSTIQMTQMYNVNKFISLHQVCEVLLKKILFFFNMQCVS
ncbi:lipoyl(octanoyl) transferase LipB [Buchnera aphidicola]|uniref:lipoyl(octanoyl) transferase LipB n=1 Tax=Buchnera aphidicola TaxID=9 RepID=UPI0031B869D8